MILGRKSNHSLGVGNEPITKKFSHKQIIQNQLENAQNRTNNLELKVQKWTNIIKKKQEDVINQLHIENEVKHQIIDMLEELSHILTQVLRLVI